eukprot:6461305-Amphidinium_carterae.1
MIDAQVQGLSAVKGGTTHQITMTPQQAHYSVQPTAGHRKSNLCGKQLFLLKVKKSWRAPFMSRLLCQSQFYFMHAVATC